MTTFNLQSNLRQECDKQRDGGETTKGKKQSVHFLCWSGYTQDFEEITDYR